MIFNLDFIIDMVIIVILSQDKASSDAKYGHDNIIISSLKLPSEVIMFIICNNDSYGQCCYVSKTK